MRNIARRIYRKLNPVKVSPRILCYHRVTNDDSDLFNLKVTTASFEKHVAFFSKNKRVLSEQEFLHCLEKGKFPNNALLITFDDGYLDNFTNAKPILEYYNIPAIFFITTGFVLNQELPWWDVIEELIRNDRESELGQLFNVSQIIHGSIEEKVSHYAAVFESSPLSRKKAFLSHYKADPALKKMMEGLFMTPAHISELRSSRLIAVGAHTHSHPSMKSLPLEEQRSEVQTSADLLRRMYGGDILSFAYPHGRNGVHFDRQTAELVKNHNFKQAFAVISNNPVNAQHRFEIPRISVYNNLSFDHLVSHITY